MERGNKSHINMEIDTFEAFKTWHAWVHANATVCTKIGLGNGYVL